MLSKANQYIFILLTGIICLTNLSSSAQKKSKVLIKNSDEVQFVRNSDPLLNKFLGNVFITHGDIKMYCDSAYQFEKLNTLEAFGNVHIINADTVHIYGDYLKYYGNTKFAEMRDNVKLKNKSVTVTTQFLDFDMNESVGYYFNGGKIVDAENTLTSNIGRYYTKQELLFFKDSVKAVTTDYTLYSDTLKYNTVSKVAFILGPTKIVGEKETLYSEDGWYNTESNISQFFKNTTLDSKSYQIKGDSIYLDRNNELARIFKNVELRDTVNNLILMGNYLETFKNTEEALMTDSAVFIQITDRDSLFLHSDSLKIEKDSAKFERIKAFHHVKFYRTDLQGICDSLVYTMQDSTIRLFNDPVLWAQQNQMVADTIGIETQNEAIRYLHFRGSSFLTAKEDTTFFNQIKGRNMLGHVKDNKLYKLDIKGNGETLYYPVDKEVIMGMNIAKSSNISILIENNKIDKIIFLKKPDGNMYPLFEVEKEMKFLKDFQWLEEYQPKSKEDIFIWKEYTPIRELNSSVKKPIKKGTL
ncbi:OstA-like protein [Labilibaculum euxinus]|uniref:Organic solvent tolerance protein OstA n=1 Tax=Labilibaculum euxinus TaxID=2686357 RepID=A0A7M4D4C3_9BACT|nr:OstA-like protein [Labilibaculum euxinus]MUP37502.1 organic solvent tolerance protein OstA [Labilibaculum euxinus]MVB06707.1 organic solvent tolerance protein OstA [Labilibaculum euxinus]